MILNIGDSKHLLISVLTWSDWFVYINSFNGHNGLERWVLLLSQSKQENTEELKS